MNIQIKDIAFSGFELFRELISIKKRLIAEKKIPDKKDNHIYPVVNIPFQIPQNWHWCYLSDLSIIQEGPGIRKHQYQDEGIQFLTVTNILEDSVDIEKSQKYISVNEYNKTYRHYTINKGDIVTACSGGSWGKSAIFNLSETLILNTSTLRLRFFEDKGDNRYLYYLTKTKYFKDCLSSYTTGQQPNYGYSHYSKIPIPLPPLPEQQRIVAILDQAFAAIDKAKANAERNLKNTKELFESYLQGVFENGNWEIKKLSEITEVKDGTHDSPKYVKEGIPFVTQKNIRPEGLSFDDIKFITKVDHEKFYKRSNVAYGDILISMIGANRGMAAIVDDERIFSIKNVGLIKSREQVDMNYLLYYLKSTLAMRYVMYMSNGGAQEFVGLTALRSFPIPFPSLSEQQAIFSNLDSISTETKRLEAIYQQKINNLEELKKSILDKAFKGEL